MILDVDDASSRGSSDDRTYQSDTGLPVEETKTKMQIATEIYKRMMRRKQVTRKEIIEQFVAEAGLSKDGASTYYQMIKCRHHRAKT
ncbi:hypothetical protein PCA31118_02430 [Pandoraea captiosa]|uniref:Uncharacterized protein n=1 Tax=Pandoraea captiosa TaxID=2508302 RepID=A0A5E5A2J1_9BURK|nr:hypothetical protein [Pandoraea captiosa]VVE66982.1 hypothetical protein PCA31118_02430 [Pandoraea captiosa]